MVRIALKRIVIITSIHKKYDSNLSKFPKGHSTKCLNYKICYIASFIECKGCRNGFASWKKVQSNHRHYHLYLFEPFFWHIQCYSIKYPLVVIQHTLARLG